MPLMIFSPLFDAADYARRDADTLIIYFFLTFRRYYFFIFDFFRFSPLDFLFSLPLLPPFRYYAFLSARLPCYADVFFRCFHATLFRFFSFA